MLNSLFLDEVKVFGAIYSFLVVAFDRQILIIIGFISTKFTEMMHLIICSMNAESEPQASDVGGG